MKSYEDKWKDIDWETATPEEILADPDGPDHQYPTFGHRQSDFEGKMEPRSPTDNELKYLRHLAWWLRLKAGRIVSPLFLLLVNPVWYFVYADVFSGSLAFSCALLLAAICILSFVAGFDYWYHLYPAGVKVNRLRRQDVLTEISGKYKTLHNAHGGRTFYRIRNRVQMLPHWRRYLLQHLHTSALAYVFPHPDVEESYSSLWGTLDKYHYPLLCRQVDCRPNPEEVDPVLSVDKEVDWGLLNTLYVNPVLMLITAAGSYHFLGMSMFAGCLWWNGTPVWATLTGTLIGKGLMATALIGGPLAAFLYARHLRVLDRIEANYAEEQNLESRDLRDRIRFSHHRYDLSEENLVYGEETTEEVWATEAQKRHYRDYTEKLKDLRERIEAREEVNEEFRARGESPPVHELQRLEELKERYNRHLKIRKRTYEQYEKIKDGRDIEALREARESLEADFIDENDDTSDSG